MNRTDNISRVQRRYEGRWSCPEDAPRWAGDAIQHQPSPQRNGRPAYSDRLCPFLLVHVCLPSPADHRRRAEIDRHRRGRQNAFCQVDPACNWDILAQRFDANGKKLYH
jgi:hypothetical protein